MPDREQIDRDAGSAQAGETASTEREPADGTGTEAKRSGRTWRSDREQFRIIFQRSPVGIFRYDRELRMTEVNDCFAAILGNRKELLVGIDMNTLKDRSIFPALIAPLEGKDGYYEGPYRATYSAADLIISMRTTPFFEEDGNLDGGLGIVEDVTARVRERENLRMFEALLEHSNDLIGMSFPDGRMMYLNRAGRVLAGLEDVADIGNVTVGDFAYPKHRPMLEAVFDSLREHGRWMGEAKLRHFRTGASVPVEMHAFSIRDPKTGKIVAFANISRDIRERKAMEREMIKSQKLESIGLLAGGIAHDFNNLLTAISGYLSLAEEHFSPGSEAAGFLSKAGKAIFRAQELTRQLLTFAKGGSPMKTTSEIGDLVRDSCSLVLRGTNVRCEVVLPPDLGLVDVDGGQICQVLNNLLINACQAMPTGGKVRIEARNTHVAPGEIPSLQEGEYVVISVSDTGIGIPGEHLPKIFDPYFTTKQQGTGLGLATSYAILKKHEGILTVRSKLGVGTTFELYLPASKRSSLERAMPAAEVVRGKGKILVMDDEESIREVATAMLRALGYRADSAKDGEEALRRYEQEMRSGEPFDAVIMDLTVAGGMGGQEATARLLRLDPKAKVIVSSGYSDTGVMAEYRTHGFSAIAPKPYNLRQIGEVVGKLLSGAE